MIMALVGAQLTSLTISREWERGTMELLISTPVQPNELMFGKLIPYLVLGWLDAAFCLALAALWFGVPYRGTLFALFVTTSLFLIVVLSIGYLMSVLIRSQVGASQIALLVTMLPTTLLSGYIFPIDQMPKVVQGITYLIYSRYYVSIVKDSVFEGLEPRRAVDADPVSCRLRGRGDASCRPRLPQATGLRNGPCSRASCRS